MNRCLPFGFQIGRSRRSRQLASRRPTSALVRSRSVDTRQQQHGNDLLLYVSAFSKREKWAHDVKFIGCVCKAGVFVTNYVLS